MTRNRRLALALIGLLLLALSLLALFYARWPLELSRVRVDLAPTLFAPP